VSTQRLRARRPMTFVVQTLGMLRKEVVEILRQPRLIVTLVLGPFLLLLLFGNSYDENRTRLLTMFVVPPGGAYEQAIDEHAESLEEYIDIAGRTDDRAAAEELLRRREVDLVVVFPDDAAERVLAGEQAVITVLNDKIDPLQRSSVEVASRLAVQEMNAAIVAAVVARAQEGVEPADVLLDDAFDAGRSMSSAAASDDSTAMSTTCSGSRAPTTTRSPSSAATAASSGRPSSIGSRPASPRCATRSAPSAPRAGGPRSCASGPPTSTVSSNRSVRSSRRSRRSIPTCSSVPSRATPIRSCRSGSG
jgi:hypothetical protein